MGLINDRKNITLVHCDEVQVQFTFRLGHLFSELSTQTRCPPVQLGLQSKALRRYVGVIRVPLKERVKELIPGSQQPSCTALDFYFYESLSNSLFPMQNGDIWVGHILDLCW